MQDEQFIRTPHKCGRLLIAPTFKDGDFDSHGVDCAFPFFHAGKYRMTYVGWDGRGYRTGLASSEDLLSWRKEGLLLDRGPVGSPTEHNVALTSILRDNALFGRGELRPLDGRYVGTYHAYPQPGYEQGAASIGLCFSRDLHAWEMGEPFLCARDGADWESGGLYKSWLLESAGTFYLFYNAKTREHAGKWTEQTGVATSPDLKNWTRHSANPLLSVGPAGAVDDVFASDPCVLQHEDKWVMFYFGLCSDGHARELAAFSSDLIHWTKASETLVDVGAPGSLDSLYAHKPGIIADMNGRLFHFYTAVRPAPAQTISGVELLEMRGITVVTA